MKRIQMVFAVLLTLCLLTGCAAAPAETEAPTLTGVLYADFSCAAADTAGSQIDEYPFEYTGSAKTAGELAAGLSELTGLDFTITAAQTEDSLTVDWAVDSTLIAGLDDREQKEDFFFHDADSLRWFMMDSLWQTLTRNLGVDTVCYTMDGGRELSFDELSPVQVFPSDIPYLGSIFYAAHADVKGEDPLFSRTAGLWRCGDEAIEMDGLGGFAMYGPGGVITNTGCLTCVDEYGDGTFRYDLYTAEGEWLAGFWFDSDTQFHMGNAQGRIFTLDTAQTSAPVLMWPSRFSGLESLETDNDFFGGYLYRDLTEDTLTVITNCCIENQRQDGETMESYMTRVILASGSWEPEELTWTESPVHTQRLTCPVYLLNWETGANEDTRGCNGFFFMTDTHTYLFCFDTAIDHQAEMLNAWDAVTETLILE